MQQKTLAPCRSLPCELQMELNASDMLFLVEKGLLQAGPKRCVPPLLTVPACICFSISTSTGRGWQLVDLELATLLRFWIQSTQIRLHLPMSPKPPPGRANETLVLRVAIDDFGRANQPSRANRRGTFHLEACWQRLHNIMHLDTQKYTAAADSGLERQIIICGV